MQNIKEANSDRFHVKVNEDSSQKRLDSLFRHLQKYSKIFIHMLSNSKTIKIDFTTTLNWINRIYSVSDNDVDFHVKLGYQAWQFTEINSWGSLSYRR